MPTRTARHGPVERRARVTASGQILARTFETDRPTPATVPASSPLLMSPVESSSGKIVVAIEVLNRDGEYAVAIATANDVEHPTDLACGLGFANGVAACDLAREAGFPAVEAAITFHPQEGLLTVVAPFFAAKTVPDADVIRYEEPLLSIQGRRVPRGDVFGRRPRDHVSPIHRGTGSRPARRRDRNAARALDYAEIRHRALAAKRDRAPGSVGALSGFGTPRDRAD